MSKTSFLTRLSQDEAGGVAIEYGLICALIVLAMFTALSGVADETIKMWTKIHNAQPGA